MLTDKIEIILTHVDEENVCLDHMSKDALISFLSVVESLKNISEDLLLENTTFSIKKGSACFGVYSKSDHICQVVKMMHEAIDGNSMSQVMTENMRKIQKEIQNPKLSYNFLYKGQNFATKIRDAKKITKRRVAKVFDYKLEILSGLFNQIGGTDPNYHLTKGRNDKITIDCTIEDAKELKHCLYAEISVIAIRKNTIENKQTYQHCVILQRKDQIRRFRAFFSIYNSQHDIINRLDSIYDFIYNSKNKEDDILVLLKVFNNRVFDVNEMKTILVLSKNMKDQNDEIRVERDKLLSLFNNLLN